MLVSGSLNVLEAMIEKCAGSWKTRAAHLRYSTWEWRRATVSSMDRLQALRLFVRVVDLGSFSKAAAEFGIGQPAATKQIAQMEQSLGARLLHRSTRGVTPTEIGALYYEKCRLIALHMDEANSVASLLGSQVKGALRISTSVAFGRRVMAPLVMRFMQRNPDLAVDLSMDDRYVDLVEQGADVAIRLGRLADSSLGARYLGMNPWVIVASADYLKAHGVPSTPADLARHEALIYSSVQGDARWHLTGPDGAPVVVPVQGRLRSNSLSTLLSAANKSMGVALLPWYVAHDDVRRGALQPVLADCALPSQEIHAVYSSPNLVTVKVRRFIEWLQEQFGEAWWERPR